MALATWNNVATALGRSPADVTPAQQAQWEHWLNGTEIVITARLGSLAQLNPSTLVYVETEVVAEKARHTRADDYTSITVSADDGSVTRRFESPQAVSAADITPEWWALLSPSTAGTAYSVRAVSPVDMPRTKP